MQEYCTNDSICRSRCLLAYFGETESSDCGICDICAEKGSHKNGKEKTADAREAIKKLLSDGRRHRLSEINELGFPEKHSPQHACRQRADRLARRRSVGNRITILSITTIKSIPSISLKIFLFTQMPLGI